MVAAQSIDDHGLVYLLGDLPDEPESAYFSTGFPELDPHWQLDAGQFVVVGSKPNVGKTAFLSQLISNIASFDQRVGLIDFESKREKTKERLWRLFLPRVHPDLDSKAAHAKSIANGSVLAVTFDLIAPGKKAEPTIDYVLDIIKIMASQRAKVVIIDPWNEMDHWRERGESLTEYTGRAIKALKRQAVQSNVCVIVAAHPAKPQDYTKKIESLYQISDSSHWFNKPDIGIILNRPKDEDGRYLDELHIDVQKVRYQDDGFKPGEVILRYDRERRRFVSLSSASEGFGARRQHGG